MLPHSSSAVAAAWAVAPADGEEKRRPAAASSLDRGCFSLGSGWWHEAEGPEEIPTRVETIPLGSTPEEVEGLGLAVSEIQFRQVQVS